MLKLLLFLLVMSRFIRRKIFFRTYIIINDNTRSGNAYCLSILHCFLILLFSLVCLKRLFKYVFSLIGEVVIFIVVILFVIFVLILVVGTSRFSGTFASATHAHRVISVVFILVRIRLCSLLFVVFLDLFEFGNKFVFF